MSNLARLTIDLARLVDAKRALALGDADPERLDEIAAALPLVRADREAENPLEAADGAVVVCDRLPDDAAEARATAAAVAGVLDRAECALISAPDRDLVGTAHGHSAAELIELITDAGMEVIWTGLTDAAGSLGRWAGVTCVVSQRHGARLRAALSGGPLGLSFDSEPAPLDGARRAARVCIATYEFVGPTKTGGIGTAYTSLAETLAAGGHEVTVLFTGWEDGTGEPFSHWMRHYANHGITLERLPQHSGERIETGHRHAVRAYEAYRWLREHRNSFDVLHFPEVLGHGYYAIEAKRLGAAFARTTIAVGTHSSTSWVLEANGTLCQALDDFADDFTERRSVARCDALISPSGYMLDWMRAHDWALPERRFIQQYARSSAVEQIAAAGPAASAPVGDPEIVFFGRLEPRKGLVVFCDALDELAAASPPAARITFLGKQSAIGGVAASEYLERRAAAWPWPIKVIDGLGQPEAVAYLKAPGQRVTVIPSLADNSPNTVYEALGLGIPFIASRVGGTAELIDPRDLAATTFDPQADRPRASREGGRSLAALLRDALGPAGLEPPRPTVTAAACREAHVRWHADIAATPAVSPPAELGPESVSLCLIGDPARAAATRRALDQLPNRRPAEVLEAVEPSAIDPSHDLVMLIPAGSTLAGTALEQLERAFERPDAELIAFPVRTASLRERVPVGGPLLAGLLRRGFGDTAFAVRRSTLERLGGPDPALPPDEQSHEFLCRAAIAGVAIDVLPELLVTGAPDDSVAPLSVVEASHAQVGLLRAFASADDAALAGLPRLTQQLFAVAAERESEFAHLYANRFGRLTLPIRRSAIGLRRARARLRRDR